MIIKGLQKLTLLDFPGRIACTVFTGGCNMRCPFCHNGGLATGEGGEDISVEELLSFLDSRAGRLSGVCVSGGEPTLQSDLADLLSAIKARGLAVKLDTNGTNPDMLKSLIDSGLIDYVAMDIKNSPEMYTLTAGLEETERSARLVDNIRRSAAILMEGGVDFEFRTTLVKELHSEQDMHEIGKWLRGGEKFFLQSYRDEGDIIMPGLSAHTPERTRELLEILKTYIPCAEIR